MSLPYSSRLCMRCPGCLLHLTFQPSPCSHGSSPLAPCGFLGPSGTLLPLGLVLLFPPPGEPILQKSAWHCLHSIQESAQRTLPPWGVIEVTPALFIFFSILVFRRYVCLLPASPIRRVFHYADIWSCFFQLSYHTEVIFSFAGPRGCLFLGNVNL